MRVLADRVLVSESSLLAALGDADVDVSRDGGSIPPTSTNR